MKRPRTSTVLGTLTGLALLAIAAHVLPGCSSMPDYIGVGFHFTTTPPSQRATPPASVATAATPAAAARP